MTKPVSDNTNVVCSHTKVNNTVRSFQSVSVCNPALQFKGSTNYVNMRGVPGLNLILPLPARFES